MKRNDIAALLADVARTQAEFEAAKTALFLARLDARRAAEAVEFGDHRSAEEMAAHYGKEGRA